MHLLIIFISFLNFALLQSSQAVVSTQILQGQGLETQSVTSPAVKKLRTKVPAKVASILKTKCADCHSSTTHFPFYADFPIARDLIMRDIEEGRLHFNMETEVFLQRDKKGFKLNEIPIATLNRIENIVIAGSMPPIQYLIAHWDKGLNTTDKETLLAWVRSLRGDIIEALPDPKTLELDEAKVELGDKLFHDNRLSADNSISCASCHDLAKGGTDQKQFSTGIQGNIGHINSPTVFNAVYNFKQFWDGRADDLFAQVEGPVHNPIEMATTWEQVTKKLSEDAEMLKLFEEAFDSKDINGDRISEAIASFEKTLITPGRFDKYLKGDRAALTSDEKKGYELFKKHNCTNCHAGPALGGQSFEKMGMAREYFADRAAGINGLRKLAKAKEDNGRFNITRRESDRYKFKVPLLRKLSSSFPYMHDGNVMNIEEAVRIMGEYQLGKKLSQDEIRLIAKFLKAI
jgi:cytochrome c peroxidase